MKARASHVFGLWGLPSKQLEQHSNEEAPPIARLACSGQAPTPEQPLRINQGTLGPDAPQTVPCAELEAMVVIARSDSHVSAQPAQALRRTFLDELADPLAVLFEDSLQLLLALALHHEHHELTVRLAVVPRCRCWHRCCC